MQKQFRGGVGSCMSALEGSLGEPRGKIISLVYSLWIALQNNTLKVIMVFWPLFLKIFAGGPHLSEEIGI